jgi:hypothetical protein
MPPATSNCCTAVRVSADLVVIFPPERVMDALLQMKGDKRVA